MDDLRLLLFTTDPALALDAEDAGLDGLIVDWEATRPGRGDQSVPGGAPDTLEDLARLTSRVSLPVTVRVNNSPDLPDEIDRALDHGAGGIMFPMARRSEEIEEFLRLLGGRAGSIVQIETVEILDQLDRIRGLPWDFAFLGFHDLMLSRGDPWLWEPLMDGTVERVFASLKGRSVGFAGATCVHRGSPVPFLMLLSEMARLKCAVTFLRRTFLRDLEDRRLVAEVDAIRACWRAFQARGPASARSDHAALLAHLEVVRAGEAVSESR